MLIGLFKHFLGRVFFHDFPADRCSTSGTRFGQLLFVIVMIVDVKPHFNVFSG
jgi:hypothetical protein